MLQSIQSTISELDSVGEDSLVSIQYAEALEMRIELVYRDMVAKEVAGEMDLAEREALPLIAGAYSQLREFVESIQALPGYISQPIQFLSGSVGRPRYEIPYHQLETLICMNLSVPKIAKIVGVSISTIRRRMNLYGLTIRATYSQMSDAELDVAVKEVQTQFPTWGNRQVYGWLMSHGIRVQFARVRECQRRTDPEGSIMRRLNRVQRRKYTVQGPRHLWHVDGHHKLIRLGILASIL